MKFISIIGYDRSGTTFLGSYYTHFSKKVFYAGEIDKALKILESGQVEFCSCGKPFPDCPIWGKIDIEIREGKLNNLKDILYRIKSLTGADIILDTSKQLSFLEEYSKIFAENFYTIHVKRNPKAVILSRMNNRKRRVKQNSHPKPHIAKRYNLMMIYDSFEWIYRNYLIEKMKVQNRNLDLTYDFFEEELPDKIYQFNRDLNIEKGRSDIDNHILWGDKRRLNFNKKISVNDSWKEDLSLVQKAVVDIITIPLRAVKGYKFQ